MVAGLAVPPLAGADRHRLRGLRPDPAGGGRIGKPCIVLRWGGYVETMVENLTAVFIEVPEADHVRRALGQLDARDWDADRIVEHAARFHEDVFVENLRDFVKAQLEKHPRS